MNPIIKLSDNAALRIKEIMSNAEKDSLGVRVSVKTGGCAGMSYVMEYTKEANPNDEVIEDKGVKVFVDSAAVMYSQMIKLMLTLHLSLKKFTNLNMLLTQLSLTCITVVKN